MNSDKPYGEVYVVTCAVNGKMYVGQTTQSTAARWSAHQKNIGRGYLFSRALAKYGVAQFSVAVVDTAESKEDLNTKEIHWIRVLGSMSPKGYNLTEGGSRDKQSEESKEKNRLANAGRKPCALAFERASLATRGKPRPLEVREKISRAHTGKKLSEAHAEKARKAGLGKKRTPEQRERMHSQLGCKRSPETREKIRQSRLGVSCHLKLVRKLEDPCWTARSPSNYCK